MLTKVLRHWPVTLLLIVAGFALAGCSPPPPLRSDKLLDDSSLITGDPCEAPCFQGITVGKTTFIDGIDIIKRNATFKDLQNKEATTDQPALAQWNTTTGEFCCQMIAAPNGMVESITLRLAPKITVGQVVEKFGEPPYTFPAEYTQEEAVIQLLYPDKGLVMLVVPGDANSSLEAGDPLVAVIYLDPTRFTELIKQANLNGWMGYETFAAYKAATPIVTAMPTLTPTP
jgi:hypothetical protein